MKFTWVVTSAQLRTKILSYCCSISCGKRANMLRLDDVVDFEASQGCTLIPHGEAQGPLRPVRRASVSIERGRLSTAPVPWLGTRVSNGSRQRYQCGNSEVRQRDEAAQGRVERHGTFFLGSSTRHYYFSAKNAHLGHIEDRAGPPTQRHLASGGARLFPSKMISFQA